MCGLCGFLDPGLRVPAAEHVALAETMAARLRHRGPDDSGVWGDREAGVALAHRRLAVIDLSPAGHQPMSSADGRWVLVFNGEIYNHRALRRRLESTGVRTWRGHSDTETLLAAIAAWGLRAALEGANGMFALALWDRRERCLWLARDRFGEKPLYYGRQGGVFLFASQPSALEIHPAWEGRLDRGALAAMLRYGNVPAPLCIYRGMRKLAPGHLLRLPFDAVQTEPSPECWWSAAEVARAGIEQPLAGDEGEALDLLESSLRRAVAARMEADVPLGAFLSGGIDSSLVVALMQARSDRPVRTFSIGFHESGFDEAVHARAVARHLGTDHHEHYVTAQEALALVPELPGIYDEPFADSSQIPTLLVTRMARRELTVALSGDGGDELFGGYNRYFWTRRIWGLTGRLPIALRRALARLLLGLSPATWERLARPLPAGLRLPQTGDKMHKLATLLDSPDLRQLYRRLISHWPEPAAVLLDAAESPVPQAPSLPDPIQWMQLQDSLGYLPDDILVKLDRAAMGVSLETRVPLLDPDLFALAWRLPPDMKIRHGQGKWALRRVLSRHLPPHLTDRPKQGFGIPLGAWLRAPLRDWAEDLLAPGRLAREGLFRPGPVRTTWAEHLSGRRNWAYRLWTLLMFQAWWEGKRR